MPPIHPIQWADGRIRIIDQTQLPEELVYIELEDHKQVARAIRNMQVRGAPALGIVAAYGLALAAQKIEAAGKKEFLEGLARIAQDIASTRPTAVNLFRALDRMKAVARNGRDLPQIKKALLAEAQLIEREEHEANRRLGGLGAELIPPGATILTHCNTGALATGSYGTALGVIRAAREQGKEPQVFATETRPLLQGSRLTVWELLQENIPTTLITDSMAGYFLKQGRIDVVVVGADRIAANGDVANKIGTYALAVLAMENGVPFYVAAPLSTIDLSLEAGDEIPIEERDPREVSHLRGVPVAPQGVNIANPAFDVTPHRYVTAIITEKGVIREPYEMRLRKLLKD
ncbi:MAG: S-methyl-5-thioribose-1-phosphate isomerase [Dehalococcoidia bacterium]